ncbi:DUF4349 domain-containing protein [Anaerobacillus sp. CMMVII]|nr:DUF4349 domain-containing protein [Anaerobacillus sp. CMMVII]
MLFACSGREQSQSSSDYASEGPMESSEEKASDGYGGQADDSVHNRSYNETERMVIYNANLSLEVKDFQVTEAFIQEKVATLGGYIIESSIYHTGTDQMSGNLVVKIPQKHFHSFINEVETASVKVIDRTVSGNDVTEEFVDLESRLRSKRVVEERLLSFLEKAEKTEDLLKISSDLGRVQEEIEQLLGRIQYLKNNVDFSTVSIYLNENKINVATLQETENLNTWVKAKSLFMDSVNGIISFFSVIIVLMIGLSPILVSVFIVGFVILLLLRKKNNKPFEG